MKDGWGRRVKILKPVVEKAMFSELNSFLYIVNLLLYSGKGKLNSILNMTKTDIFEENFGDVRQKKNKASQFACCLIVFPRLIFCSKLSLFAVPNSLSSC